MAIVILGCMTDNSGRLKNRRNSTKLRKKTAAVAAMTQTLCRAAKNQELITDQHVAGWTKPGGRRRSFASQVPTH